MRQEGELHQEGLPLGLKPQNQRTQRKWEVKKGGESCYSVRVGALVAMAVVADDGSGREGRRGATGCL